MSKPITLVVDDEPDIRELLEITLARMDIGCRSAGSLKEALSLLEHNPFDLCLTDMKLPDGDGLDLVRHIQEAFPALPVAVITAHGSMDTAVRALKMGAFDFVSKPIDLAVLRKLVDSALRLGTYPQRDRRSRHQLLGDSPVMREIRSKIAKVARSQAPVYISGESGTGKELVARLIHEKSSRHDKAFVAINCGAIPSELMESEFFGHLKGSFTGAVADKPGLFRAADGGTLFLDEVADLPQSLQVKLLRAIQEKRVRPVGAQQEIPVDIRILSATHKNLTEMVDQGAFRQDLYYRINVIELVVPPLRERSGDIAALAEHILNKLSHDTGLVCTELLPDALSALQKYSFPGNVRELENILERAMALCEDNRISAADLGLPEYHTFSIPATAQAVPSVNLENYMDEIEKQAIIQALEQTRWNRTAAAKQLGITFRALRYRLKKLGLE
ncbi:MAG: sigma-54-dependent transcriptional regulator [Gammaproteobacteria bacterium]